MLSNVRLLEKRLITHKACGKQILLRGNYLWCPSCQVAVRQNLKPRPLPKLRVPRVLKRQSDGAVLPKAEKLPKGMKLKLPKELKHGDSSPDVVLPMKTKTQRIEAKLRREYAKTQRAVAKALKVMNEQQVDKPVVQAKMVSKYQQEILAAWQAR